MYSQNIEELPAITIQLNSQAIIKGKFAKMKTEVSYGVWIGLDHKNNSLIFKIIQDTNNSTVINIDEIKAKIESIIFDNEDFLKKYLSDIVDIQELFYYMRSIQDYFNEVAFPSVGAFSSLLVNEYVLGELNYTNANISPDEKLREPGRAFADIDIDKFTKISPNSLKINLADRIRIWQKSLNIDKNNLSKINNIYKTLQRYIDNSIFNIQTINQETCSCFGLSACSKIIPSGFTSYIKDGKVSPTENNLTNRGYSYYQQDNSANYSSMKFDPSGPFTIQFAEITNMYDKSPSTDLLSNKYVNIKTSPYEVKTRIKAFYYFPPVPSQYEDWSTYKPFEEKLNDFEESLKKMKRNSIFKENAGKVIKEKANGIVTQVIDEVKKYQKKFNTEIDKVTNEIKNIFGEKY
jgi:hypothetical protein